MKKSNYLLAFLAILLVGILYLPQKNNKREIYSNRIQKELKEFQHQLQITDNNTLKGEEKALGQPDMASLQDYYQTMDPQEMRVPQERLIKARQEMKQMLNNRSSMAFDNMLWENIPSNMGGRTRSLMWDPNSPTTVWAGSVTGGIWRNSDISSPSSEWEAVDDFMASLSVSSLCYDPNNTQVFYAGTGEAPTAIITYRESSGRGIGIWKSVDGGNTWNILESTQGFAYVTDVKVRNEDGTSVIYAGVASGKYMGEDHTSNPSDGLYRSTDGGESWEQVLPNISELEIPYTPDDIEFGADGRIYVGTMRNINGDGGAVILFSDEGTSDSWTVNEDYKNIIENGMGQYYLPGRVMLSPAPSDENIVYAIIGAGYTSGFGYYKGNFILKSIDKGESWAQMNLPGNDETWASLSWHAFSIAVDPNDSDHFYIGGLDEYHSLNGGTSYKHVSDWAGMYYGGGNDYIHADQHHILFKPGSSSEIVFASDGGVFYTNNGHQNFPIFQERNHLYTTLQFYTCDINPNIYSDNYIGGLQDNGTLLYQGEPLDINDMIYGGDGAFCFYDKNDANVILASYYYNRYAIFENGNEAGYLGNNATGTFISPADFDYNANILYGNGVGFFGQDANTIFRGTGIPNNPSSSLVPIGTNINTWFTHIAYSPYSPLGKSTIFVGSAAGDLFKVEEAQGSPEATAIGSEDFPTASISCVAIGGSEDTLLLTFSNYGVSSIWQTYNGGTDWREVEGNLPDMPIRWAIYQPEESTQALIATELGVWRSNNLDEENVIWEPVIEGMANVRVDMLKLREGDLKVLAASHGRGLFTTTFDHISVGIHDIGNNDELTVGPNPSNGNFYVQLNHHIDELKTLEIYNTQGQKVYSEQYKGDHKMINVNNLASGLYILNVTVAEQNYTEKIKIN